MTDIPFEIDRELKWENPEGWYTIVPESCCDQRCWVSSYARVVGNAPTASEATRFFVLDWELPSTESSEGSESDDVEVREVFPHQVITTVYKTEKPA